MIFYRLRKRFDLIMFCYRHVYTVLMFVIANVVLTLFTLFGQQSTFSLSLLSQCLFVYRWWRRRSNEQKKKKIWNNFYVFIFLFMCLKCGIEMMFGGCRRTDVSKLNERFTAFWSQNTRKKGNFSRFFFDVLRCDFRIKWIYSPAFFFIYFVKCIFGISRHQFFFAK